MAFTTGKNRWVVYSLPLVALSQPAARNSWIQATTSNRPRQIHGGLGSNPNDRLSGGLPRDFDHRTAAKDRARSKTIATRKSHLIKHHSYWLNHFIASLQSELNIAIHIKHSRLINIAIGWTIFITSCKVQWTKLLAKKTLFNVAVGRNSENLPFGRSRNLSRWPLRL